MSKDEQKFKVGDLVRFAAQFMPYNQDKIGVVVEVSISLPLHSRYYVQWDGDGPNSNYGMWYAPQHLEKIA